MTVYKLGWDAVARVAHVQSTGNLPAGVTDLGTFTHDEGANDGAPTNSAQQANHTIFHHVRDRLYHVGQQNMQEVKVVVDGSLNPDVVDIEFTTANANVTVGGTKQLAWAYTPVNANVNSRQFVSSNPARATVSSTGLVTGVSAGAFTITITSDGVSDTLNGVVA